MQLTDQDIKILTNFASIQPNIVLGPGSSVLTLAEGHHIAAAAELSQEIPRESPIYDLGEFLQAVSLLEEPSFRFTDKAIVMSGGGSQVRYFLTDKEMLTFPPREPLVAPTDGVLIHLSDETLTAIRKACSALKHDVMTIASQDQRAVITVSDPTIDTSNAWATQVDIERNSFSSFSAVFSVANMKLIRGSYDVQITPHIYKFTNTQEPVRYYMAPHRLSTFTE